MRGKESGDGMSHFVGLREAAGGKTVRRGLVFCFTEEKSRKDFDVYIFFQSASEVLNVRKDSTFYS